MKKNEVTTGTTVQYRKVGLAKVVEIVEEYGAETLVHVEWITGPRKYRSENDLPVADRFALWVGDKDIRA